MTEPNPLIPDPPPDTSHLITTTALRDCTDAELAELGRRYRAEGERRADLANGEAVLTEVATKFVKAGGDPDLAVSIVTDVAANTVPDNTPS